MPYLQCDRDASECCIHYDCYDATRSRLMRRLATLANDVTLAPSPRGSEYEELTIDGKSATIRIWAGYVVVWTGLVPMLVGLPKYAAGWDAARAIHDEVADQDERTLKRHREAVDKAWREEAKRREEAEKKAALERTIRETQTRFNRLQSAIGVGRVVSFSAHADGKATINMQCSVTLEQARAILEAGAKSGAFGRYLCDR